MEYRVSIAQRPDGSVEAWVVNLPGCRAAAGSRKDAMDLLPVVIGDHLAWLAGHGEPISHREPSEIEVVETIEVPGDYLFASDREAMTRAELNAAVTQAGYAHADLMERLRTLPDVVLDWVPPASAVKIDRIFPDVRSMRDMLEHLVTAEANFLIGSLVEEPVSGSLPLLGDLHEHTAKRLFVLPEESLGKVFTRVTARGETQWTVRKSMRRTIFHKRFHTREIEQRLCWLTLGVPELLPQNRE